MNNSKKSDFSAGALAGVVVLEHSTALSGPYCAQLLGDLGAEVIKIERPGEGDQSRGWGPPFAGEQSAYFLSFNRNKRGLTLDLSKEKGREVLRRLLPKTDVLIHNLPRQSSRAKLGLDDQSCRTLNPRLVLAAISGFGDSGPYAERPGYDIIAQGMGGAMAITGEPNDGPIRFPTPIADMTTAIYTALAIVSALFARERTGQGQMIDTALFDCQATWLANVAGNYLLSGEPVCKLGNTHPNIVPYQPFATVDGWIIVAVGSQRLWEKFTSAVESPELLQDLRFKNNAARLAHRQELVTLLSEKFCQRTSQEWLQRLQQADIPAGPIYRPEQTLTDAQLLARGMVIEIEHPAAGLVRSLGNPMKLGATPITYRRPAPLLGEHNGEILSDLGYEIAEIAGLQADKVI